MSVIIRCRRTGANNDPCFRLVATDSRSPRDGKFLETLGWYDPKKRENNFSLKLERIEAWISKGAQLSPTARILINKAKRGLTSTTTRRKKHKAGGSKKAAAKKSAAAKETPAPKETPPPKEAAAPTKTPAPAAKVEKS